MMCVLRTPSLLEDSMAGEDPEFIAWLRSQKCCAPDSPGGCQGPTEPHHASQHGMGQRAHDHMAIPLCHHHHIEQWHRGSGVFKTWTKEQKRSWFAERLSEVWQRYNARRPSDFPA